jgi:transcriptional regulator with XRE-family HTH domain
MVLVPPPEAARRVRAAMGYSGMTFPELAAKTGLKKDLLRNIASRTRPSGGTLDRLYVIADACRIPRQFMEHGWRPFTARGEDPPADRLDFPPGLPEPRPGEDDSPGQGEPGAGTG